MSDTAQLSSDLQEALTRFEALPGWDAPRLVSLDDLEFCSWNVNKMDNNEFSALVEEIETNGFDEPIGIIPILEEPGRYLVPSGEHRARAAVALEMKAIPAVLKLELSKLELHEVQQWSVKRNNIRGKIQVQRYIDLERSWADKHNVRAKAARDRILMRGELLKKIRKNQGALDNEGIHGDGGSPSSGPIVTGDDLGDPSGPAAPSERGSSDADGRKPPSDSGPATDGEKDARAQVRDRKRMEKSFKTAWEQSLMDCPDTVANGYLILADGDQTHMVVDTNAHLAGLVSRMNAACRQEGDKVSEFLITALRNELKNWEDK